MADIEIRVPGADELARKLSNPDAVRIPMANFLKKSGYVVEAEAKRIAPVDTGRLRASIATKVSDVEAVVSPRVDYAPYVEFGTRPHFPPLSALQPWARRHGFGPAGAFLVARAIARRGTRARLFMTGAAKTSLTAIHGFVNDMAQEIRARLES